MYKFLKMESLISTLTKSKPFFSMTTELVLSLSSSSAVHIKVAIIQSYLFVMATQSACGFPQLILLRYTEETKPEKLKTTRPNIGLECRIAGLSLC